jgi:hypothetical protein
MEKKSRNTYVALCERVARLEVKMNILAFVSGATFAAVLATLFKLISG